MNAQYWLNCGLLRLFGDFDTQPDAHVPCFEYRFDEPELATLRQRYELAQVAGGGDDWSRVLNLFALAVQQYVTNGETCPSVPLNVISLPEYSFGKRKEGGINCYIFAAVLVQACLCVLILSRVSVELLTWGRY